MEKAVWTSRNRVVWLYEMCIVSTSWLFIPKFNHSALSVRCRDSSQYLRVCMCVLACFVMVHNKQAKFYIFAWFYEFVVILVRYNKSYPWTIYLFIECKTKSVSLLSSFFFLSSTVVHTFRGMNKLRCTVCLLFSMLHKMGGRKVSYSHQATRGFFLLHDIRTTKKVCHLLYHLSLSLISTFREYVRI